MKSDTQSLFGRSAANCLFTLSSGQGRRLVADRGLHPLASDNPLQAHGSHEPCDGAPSNRDAFARQLPPDLAYPIDAEVLRENPPDVNRQLGVPLRPLRQAIRIGFPAGVFVPGGWGNVQTLHIGSTPNSFIWASMKPITSSTGGRAPPPRNKLRLSVNLVRLTKLTDLALERLDPLAFIRRQARSLARVALGLANPTAKRLGSVRPILPESI